ncbi:Txe/YoeB family addiction module toxin [uncultured Porphyromonas sp.]|uniref:Txe/YoeB family addiction module toxin n=1 Tax=uncultured Porphyromonas sp. TaxID=159274 RepID=UPI0026245C77|nr:Txe/YoeB family addiction module toxin [uncultured Porphyromonas sp.]
MNIKLTKDAERDYKKLIRNGQKNILKKLVQIFNELEVNPREGIGQPERLKYFRDKEVWSRKLDKKNRIVYLIIDEELVVLVISVLGHYDDK